MTKENKEMKSRFTYGMFAGFALACLFFFFFLFFFPNVFRNLAAKNSPNYYPVAAVPSPVGYANEYVAYGPQAPAAYYDDEYVAYNPQVAPAEQPYTPYDYAGTPGYSNPPSKDYPARGNAWSGNVPSAPQQPASPKLIAYGPPYEPGYDVPPQPDWYRG